ncbi:hypothetical protein ACFL1H_00315 [Nanoarchaeota archaeon]
MYDQNTGIYTENHLASLLSQKMNNPFSIACIKFDSEKFDKIKGDLNKLTNELENTLLIDCAASNSTKNTVYFLRYNIDLSLDDFSVAEVRSLNIQNQIVIKLEGLGFSIGSYDLFYKTFNNDVEIKSDLIKTAQTYLNDLVMQKQL